MTHFVAPEIWILSKENVGTHCILGIVRGNIGQKRDILASSICYLENNEILHLFESLSKLKNTKPCNSKNISLAKFLYQYKNYGEYGWQVVESGCVSKKILTLHECAIVGFFNARCHCIWLKPKYFSSDLSLTQVARRSGQRAVKCSSV